MQSGMNFPDRLLQVGFDCYRGPIIRDGMRHGPDWWSQMPI